MIECNHRINSMPQSPLSQEQRIIINGITVKACTGLDIFCRTEGSFSLKGEIQNEA